jgi:hypothetical protein
MVPFSRSKKAMAGTTAFLLTEMPNFGNVKFTQVTAGTRIDAGG